MTYIEGIGRNQQTLFPQALDDYIASDNPVRFLDAFVQSLDMKKLGFERAEPADTGRPGYDPRDLLGLYVYGYLNRIRSSRRLENETRRNVELMWLVRRLTPDFKTIADFRRDNKQAIRNVARHFVVLCREMDLFGKELVAIDGSKFRADNNRSRNFNEKKLRAMLEQIDATLDEYLGQLDQQDQEEESPATSGEELRQKIALLAEKKARCESMLDHLEQTGETQVSLTDPDSRAMKMRLGVDVCYNAQIAVDEKHKLIVAEDVTNEVTDQRCLSTMAIAAKEAMDAEMLNVVADVGYASGHEVKACIEHNITPYVARPVTSANAKRGMFTKDDFRYDPQRDVYVCPANQELTFRSESFEQGRHIRYYKTANCRGCALRPQCTTNKETRRISRRTDEHLQEQTWARVAERPDIMKKRKAIVEHPFGALKRFMDSSYFLTRGLDGVRAEFSLATLAYNIKRVLAIVSFETLMQRA